MKLENGPELWEKILSHFPEGSVIAGGAVRDYVLGVEPKDIDVFTSYQDYNVEVEGMKHLDLDSDDHAEEYLKMREIAIVMKGEIEGWPVDYVGMHFDDPVKMIEAFDTGISQAMFIPSDGKLLPTSALYKKKAFIDDVENKTVTVLNGDRIGRTKARFERFNSKMDGAFTLVIPDDLEVAPVEQDFAFIGQAEAEQTPPTAQPALDQPF